MEATRMKDKGRESQELKGTMIPAYGGHIVRSTGRKDRHSKVLTAKGLRDRRVRLSALTAIQFYDVQDRLGYDRPSKAVDWLMQHAKAAIEQLTPRGDDVYPLVQSQRREAVEAEKFAFSDSREAGNVSGYQNCITGTMSRDLCLSLQSLQQEQFARDSGQQAFFCGGWNAAATAEASSVGYSVAFAPEAVAVVDMSGYTQREPLQSSNLSTIRSWVDSASSSTHSALIPIVENLVTGENYGGFSGFSFPARIQGNGN